MTGSFSLGPIPKIVLMHHSQWPRHANQDTKMNKHVFKPDRTLVAVMYKPPMHPQGMPQTQCQCSEAHEQ